MIWATVSSWSCFCWLYRASPSLAAKNIINLILVLTIWWCPCVESSLILYVPSRLQSARLPWPSPPPRACSDSCPLIWWYHLIISSSVIPFSFHFQSFPASGPFQMSQLFTSDSQSIGVSPSTSVLQMIIQDWFPLEWTGWISLQFKGLSRVFSNTIVQKHQFFGTQLSL